MILKKISLQNFLSHSDSVVEFNPNGITAIIGENGSGKSSIIEAIQFALFGDSDKGNLANLVKWGKKEAIVELEFENQLGLFKIHREIARTSKGASSQNSVVYKFEKGSYRLFYQKNLKSELPKLTGLTKKTFQTSGLIKQGEIEGFLRIKPSEREKLIEELLGIQYYQKLISKYNEIKKSIKDKIEILTERKTDISSVIDIINNKETQLNEINSQLYKVDSYINRLKTDLEQLRKNLEDIHKTKAQIDSKENIKSRILDEINSLKEKLSEIADLRQKLPQLEVKYNNYKELKEKYKKLEIVEKLLLQKISLSERKAQFEENLSFVENFKKTAYEFEKAEEEIKHLKKQLENINNILNTIEKKEIERENIEKSIKEIEEDLKFLQEFENIAKEYEEKQLKIKQISQQLTQLSQKVGQINQLKSNIEKLSKELNSKQEQLVQISQHLKDNYHQKFQTLKLNPLMIDEFIFQNDIKLQHLSEEKENITKEIAELETEGKQYRQKLENLTSIEAICPTCSRPIDSHEKHHLIQDIETTLNSLRSKHKDLRARKNQIEEEIKKQTEIKKFLTEFKNIFDSYLEKKSEKESLQATLTAYQQQISKLPHLEQEKEKIEKFISEHSISYGRYRGLKEKNIEKEAIKLRQFLLEIDSFLKQNSKEILEKEKEEILNLISNHEQFLSKYKIDYGRYKSLQEEKLKQETSNIEKQLKDIEDKLYEYEEFRNLYLDEINALKTKLLEDINKLENIQNEYFLVQERIKEESLIVEQIQIKEKEAEKIESEIKSFIDKVNLVDENKLLAEIDYLEKKLENLADEKEQLISEKAKIETEIKTFTDILETAKQELKELENLKEKLNNYESVIETLTAINKHIKDNAIYMLPKLTEEIFSRFNFPNFSGLKFDDKYSIVLPVNVVGTQTVATVDSLSGGQRIALALALRFAISKMLNNRLEFLILDEPTIHMDKYRKRELVDLIGDLKEKNFVRQLIVVTHDEEIEERADTIYKVDAGQVELV